MSLFNVPTKLLPLVISALGFAVLGLCIVTCFIVWRRIEFRSNFTKREWRKRKQAIAQVLHARVDGELM